MYLLVSPHQTAVKRASYHLHLALSLLSRFSVCSPVNLTQTAYLHEYLLRRLTPSLAQTLASFLYINRSFKAPNLTTSLLDQTLAPAFKFSNLNDLHFPTLLSTFVSQAMASNTKPPSLGLDSASNMYVYLFPLHIRPNCTHPLTAVVHYRTNSPHLSSASGPNCATISTNTPAKTS
jgi:hypothetical protein